ncbi:MAG: ribonuclease J [Candidatus Howiella sp.]
MSENTNNNTNTTKAQAAAPAAGKQQKSRRGRSTQGQNTAKGQNAKAQNVSKTQNTAKEQTPPKGTQQKKISGGRGQGQTPAGNAQKSQPKKKPAAQGQAPVPEKAQKTGGKKRGGSSKKGGHPVRIIPLGGLNEIGKNITLYEYNGEMILVDCGMAFPDEDLPGVDIVIPDFTYVLNNKDKIRGLFVTHGHEDHIGSIPYLLKEFNLPVYGTKLTLGLITGKLREHRLDSSAKLVEIKPGDTVQLGAFSVEAIHVNHSIPDAVAYAIRTPAGLIVQTGDFKIDTTPIDDEMLDIARFAELGKEGVLALLSDSTNAERPGYTPSERIVGDSFSNLFKRADDNAQRIIIASFSSNIHRIQQIVDEAVRSGRKVAVSGRSMINVVGIASELGYLKIPDGVLIDIDLIRRYKPEQLVIITTGSQGEPMSALYRMAYGDHRKVEIVPGDMVIISATPIPGNEKLVSKVVNELMKLGADVIYEKMYDVHVSGHACQGEQKLMLSIVKPKYFIPVHGEQKHLTKHAGLAYAMGLPKENVILPDIGNVIEVRESGIKVADTVPAGRVLVDGYGVGDVGSVVLRDRKHLAEDGLFVVVIAIDSTTGEVVSGPDLISRGFVYVKESEELLDQAREVACDVLENCYVTGVRDWGTIKTRVRDGISKFLYERTKRSPMILPIIMDV